MTDDKKPESKYWICDECADVKKLETKYPNGGNTCTEGDCDWCGQRRILTPIVDFKGSKGWD